MRSKKTYLSWLPAVFVLLSALGAKAEAPKDWEKLWSVHFDLWDHGSESSPALAPDGTVYQASFLGWLYAVTADGAVKWKFKAHTEIRSSPAVAGDGTIYFGSRDRKLYALSPAGKLKWSFTTGGWVDSSPALAADGTVYFGSWDKNFYALTPEGKLKWSFAAGNLIYSSPAIAVDGTLYFSSNDGYCYALHPDGTEFWRLHTGGYLGSSPVLDTAGNLFLTAEISHICISRDGKLCARTTSQFPLDNVTGAAAASGVFIASMPWRNIGAFDSTGKWERKYGSEFGKMDSSSPSSPNLNTNGVVYICDDHILYALKPLTNAVPAAKSSWPLWRADAQHTGRVQVVK